MYFEIHGLLTTNIYPASNTVWVRAFDLSNNVSTAIVHTAYSTAIKREYEYDLDGNLAEYPKLVAIGSTNILLAWDAENRLTGMVFNWKTNVSPSSPTMTNGTEFTYDGAHRLRQVREYNVDGLLTNTARYVWSGFQLMGELDGSNKLVRTFTHGVDVSGTIGGAGGIGGLVGIRSYAAPLTNYYVRHDGKGNVTEVRRQNGTVAASYGYSPFGQLLYQTNTYNQPFRFQSKLFHSRSGYSCFGFRWYSGQSGSWLSRDPIQENGGINLYQYAGNNPVNYVDPLGLQAYELWMSDPLPTPEQTEMQLKALEYGSMLYGAGALANGLRQLGLKAFGKLCVRNAAKTASDRVFWSGGTISRESAEAFARSTGGQTLEMTKTGKFLDAITTEKTYPYLKPLWNKASQNFARGADGTVDVFQSSQGVRLESIWRKVEYPELIKAGNPINYHVTP